MIGNNSEQTPLCRPVRNTGDQGGQFLFLLASSGSGTDKAVSDSSHGFSDVSESFISVSANIPGAKVTANWKNPGFMQIGTNPVTCVSWNDAKAFIKWFNAKEKLNSYRLHSEAEREYTGRAGKDMSEPFFR